MKSFYSLLGISNTQHEPGSTFSRPYTTSWLFSPFLLASTRLLLALYSFTCIFYTWGFYGTHQEDDQVARSFSYFTDLSYWGVAFYFLVAGIHTLMYALKGRCWLDSWPRALKAMHSFYYTTIVTLPFLVTIVYWSVLFDGFHSRFSAWSNVSKHAMNSSFAATEIVLPTTNPPPVIHLLGLVLILALYLGVAYITRASEGFYTYSFLDPSKGSGRVAGYVFAILGGFILLFAVAWCLIWFRRKSTPGPRRSRLNNTHGNADVEHTVMTTIAK